MTADPNFHEYAERLGKAAGLIDAEAVEALCQSLLRVWKEGQQVFLCGNGGSGGNALHMANDFVYGIDRESGKGIRAHALTANVSVVTCLANDEGYDEIFAKQLAVYARPGDLLIALSGSGNSPNILKALDYANANEIETFAILGYSGGAAKDKAQLVMHAEIDDMQISEDLQTIILHHVMQWLCEKKNGKTN